MSFFVREVAEAAGLRSAFRHACSVALRVAVAGALLVLYGFAASLETRAQETRAELSAAMENGHARLIFSFAGDVKADVQISNNILIVSFNRPVDVATDLVKPRLPGYVQAVRRDPDGTAVRMSLGRKVTVNSMEAGDKLFVDLLPESWRGLPPGLPQSVVDDLAKRARDAEKGVPRVVTEEPVLAAVTLRVSKAPTFSRFSFDLPMPMPVAVERDGQELRLHFESRVLVDLGGARAQLPRGVVGLDVAFGVKRSTVKLVLAPNADARDFREDRSVMVDVTPGPMGAAPTPGVQELAAAADRDAERERAAQAAAAQAQEEARAAIPVGPSLAEAGDDVAPAPLDFSTGPDGRPGAVVPFVGRHEGQFTVEFSFGESVSAAAFTRGEDIWLVFDTLRDIDVTGITEEPTRAVHEVRALRSDSGAVVRLRPSIAKLPSFERDGNIWRLTLADSVAVPSRPLPVRRSPDPERQGAVFVPLESPIQVHRLPDPSVGDELLIVTALPPARGILREQTFVEFHALASMHGLALAPLADDLGVALSAEGVTVSRPEGLAVSSVAMPVPGAVRAAEVPGKPSIVSRAGWEAEQAADFGARESELVTAVSLNQPGQRIDARLTLARFYLANGFAAEAIGTLETGAREDNQLLARPLYHFLRGTAELEIGRPADAIRHFKHKTLGDLSEAQLLRGVAEADLGRWTASRDAMRLGGDAVDGLPLELQRRIYLAGARAAVEVRDLNEATHTMRDLELMGVPPSQQAKFTLLSGRMAENVGRFDRARTLYESLSESEAGPPAAEARFRSIAMRLARNELDRPKAIERLEALAITWRGDRIELDTLRLLGRLYVGEMRYRDAFRLLDAALVVDDEAEATHEFHSEMAAVFEDLFLSGKADTLPAIEALALYYDFSRLTPIGRRGDELIRRLADRLVSVDLLDQAVELLDHQVNYRLTGAAKAQVAAKLAVVHLMNRKPTEAVRTLAATRMQGLPKDLREQRLFIEARALSETGRHDTALELMEALRGPDADRLRADIHWAAKHWREAGERLEAIVGERWKAEGPLDAEDRHDVLRAALAYTLGEEGIGLARVKDKFAQKMGATTEGKVLGILVSSEGVTPRAMTEAARALASFDSLGTFLKRYRERYPDQPLPADPATTSSLFKLQRASAR